MDELLDAVKLLVTAVTEQQRTIRELQDVVAAQLTAKAAAPTEPAPEPDGKPTPVDWDTLTGQRRWDTWLALASFVETIVIQHELHFDVMPCWWRHRDAVQLLTALWQVHQVSSAADAGMNGRMSWLDTLGRNIPNFKGIFKSCRDGHLDTTPHVWMPDQVRDEFFAMARSDAFGAQNVP